MSVLTIKQADITTELQTYDTRLTSMADGVAKVIQWINYGTGNTPAQIGVSFRSELGPAGVDATGKIQPWAFMKTDGGGWPGDIDPDANVDVASDLQFAVPLTAIPADSNSLLIDLHNVFLMPFVGTIIGEVAIAFENVSGAALDNLDIDHETSATRYDPEVA